MLPPTQYRLYGRRFYRSKDPTNSIKILKEHKEYTKDRKNTISARTQSQIGDRSFSVAGPRLWNNLPTEIQRRGTTFGHYRQLLKAFLFV